MTNPVFLFVCASAVTFVLYVFILCVGGFVKADAFLFTFCLFFYVDSSEASIYRGNPSSVFVTVENTNGRIFTYFVG